MAKVQGKGSLQDRINKENARAQSRHATPKERGGRRELPPGIENGVAKLTRVDFNVIEDGQYAGSQRCYMHAVVVEPKTAYDPNLKREVKVEGSLVQPGMITFADVTSQYGDTSFAENVAKAEERLKRCGFPTEDFEDLENDTLNYFNTGEDMYVEFNTWQPEDSNRVIHLLNGPLPDYIPIVEDDVQEVTAETTSPAATESQPLHYEGVSSDPADLGAAADNGDETAQHTLGQTAQSLGINPEDPKYNNWAAVAVAIAQASAPVSSNTTSVVQSEGAPEIGDVYGYKPPRAQKEKDCEITDVSLDNATVSLKSLEDDIVFEGVTWDKLVPIS